jgi:glucose-6-phosphate 1-dehydrogenase
VQITVSETVGVGSRGGYYDHAGALRDMVQNHLLQLLCLVAMEPPTYVGRENVRDEKLKVLQALKPLTPADVDRDTVRGQYVAGLVEGERAASYVDDLGDLVEERSETETFVALKAEVQNWRWAGVPFYLRTGKRMDRRVSEIVVVFKEPPHAMFPGAEGGATANRLANFDDANLRRSARAAVAADADVIDEAVTASGRLELRWYLREQSVSRTLHRFGNLVGAEGG